MFPSLFIGLAMTVGAPAGNDDPKDPGALVGTWVEEKAVVDGEERPGDRVGVVFTFAAGGTFSLQEVKRKRPSAGTYKVDPEKDPTQIDFHVREGDRELTIHGNFKRDGDTLTLCFGRGKPSERPAKFESPAGSKVMLMTLKRAKKKD